MERDRPFSSSEVNKKTDQENATVIQWEDFEQEVARLWSLSSALNEAKQKKQSLQQKLDSLIQVEAESLSQLNELEEMQEKLEARKLIMEKISMRSKLAAEDAMKKEESLSIEVRSLLVAGTALSVARKRLQLTNHIPNTVIENSQLLRKFDLWYLLISIGRSTSWVPETAQKFPLQFLEESNRLLAGEKGCVHLRNLQKKLRTRQQYMISQVSLLYPVKISVGPAQEQELELLPSTSISGNSAGSKPVNHGSLIILGLHLTMLPFKTMSFFIDKKEVQRSATALGYVAHAVSLIASYLKVPLRYPLRLGGSHSYIVDYAPSIEPSSDSSSISLLSTSMKHVEFPLFLEGQDTTRAAYAVFLLNKDLEQLLNFTGVKSLGPRHVLANLKELLRIIQSAHYIET